MVRGSLALASQGLTDLVWGHLAIRDTDDRGLWMKAAGWGYEEVEASRVLLVSFDGEVLAGSGPRHIEYLIHSSIMARRPQVKAVVHAHNDTVNAFASLDVPLRAISHAGIEFAQQGLPRFTKTANLIRTPALGAELAETLGTAPGLLIPHHGLVTVGETVGQAVMRAVMLTRACHTQLMAESAGGPAIAIGEEINEMGWPEPQVEAGWNYLQRRSGT